jgi:hypothetical protein
MIKLYCDICGYLVQQTIKVQLVNGEHPHNGSTMYHDFDVCFDCACKIPNLKANIDIEDVRKK